ncbi:MAG: aldehyde ferredoxin oxidoreductase family protein [Anaerolineae bacterium]
MAEEVKQWNRCGYAGRVLRVNLSTGRIWTEEPDERFYRAYFGGWGFIAHYLLKEVPVGADPLGPANLLVFATGLVTGVPIAGAGRSAVGAKSPLTGGFGGAEAGGWFGAELVAAGFDAIVISGQSREPVYLWVHDGQAELRPAAHLWGLLTADAQMAIRTELGDARVRVAQVGPAGEQMARLACIMHDVNRAAGRGGLGAVMGSKKLKAVAVRGTGRPEVADKEALQGLARWYAEHYKETWALGLQDLGTSGGVAGHQMGGGLPTRNFQEGTFEGYEGITGERMRDTVLIDRDTCFSCPVRCKRVVQINEGPFTAEPVYGGPEYETVGAFGSSCAVGDLAAVCRANQLCNAYGLDTISAGMTIAWAMECFERGLITTDDTGGLALPFGEAAAMVRLVEEMGRGEGFGALLRHGSLYAAQQVGRSSEQYAMHAKGLEIPMHEPRVKYALGLGYAVSPTGADHNHNIHDDGYGTERAIERMKAFGILEPLAFSDLSPAKMRLAAIEIPWATLMNTLSMCGFVFFTFERHKLVELVKAITGWDSSLLELLKSGERAYTMARAFNTREGLTAASDTIPARFFAPFTAGPSAGNALPQVAFDEGRRVFCEMMGWDPETGAPRVWKLHELGIGWVADELRRAGRECV